MLSNAGSKTFSVNSLGTILLVLEVLEEVVLDSKLAGRSRVFSHGHTTFSLADGDVGPKEVLF